PDMRPVRRLVLLLTLAGVLMLLTSCGTGRKPLYPVRGKVLVDGKAAKDVFVYFFPPDDTDPKTRTMPQAQTDANGEFSASTYVQGEGAPVDEYRLAFEWPMPSGVLKNNFNGPDRLKGRYADHKKSPHRITVKTEPNDLGTFQLTTKGE